MKVSRLKGKALDWAVAKCEELTWLYEDLNKPPPPGAAFSTDWSLAGPIIDREKLEITPWGVHGEWRARDFYEPSPGVPCAEQFGPTPLIAAMRCLVASKFGDEIHVPEELK